MEMKSLEAWLSHFLIGYLEWTFLTFDKFMIINSNNALPEPMVQYEN